MREQTVFQWDKWADLFRTQQLAYVAVVHDIDVGDENIHLRARKTGEHPFGVVPLFSLAVVLVMLLNRATGRHL